jgi:hypothetical protein
MWTQARASLSKKRRPSEYLSHQQDGRLIASKTRAAQAGLIRKKRKNMAKNQG